MGTRSLTVFIEPEETWQGEYYPAKEIVVMYRQYDGYPTGHGVELAKFLAGMKMVNGMGAGDPEKIANGMGCLAAQVIAHFKDGPGGIYLYTAGTRDAGEEYIYKVYGKTGKEPTIEIFEVPWNEKEKQIFKGTATKALRWCKSQN